MNIAGFPAVAIRDLIRRNFAPITARTAAHTLGVDLEQAQRVLTDLEELGYLERLENGLYPTELGNRLALAKATAPIKRATADRLAFELVGRVKHVNRGDYAYKVPVLVAFGSYLSDQSRIGDLDVAIYLEPRTREREEFERLRQRRIDLLDEQPGYQDFVMRLFWPEEEVPRALKGGSRYISITNLAEDPTWARNEFRILYAESNAWKLFVGEMADLFPEGRLADSEEIDRFKEKVGQLASKARSSTDR